MADTGAVEEDILTGKMIIPEAILTAILAMNVPKAIPTGMKTLRLEVDNLDNTSPLLY